MILPSDLYKAHMSLHPYLPVEEKVCREYLEMNPIMADCCDLEYVANMFADYVGSQGLYEEGAEESW